MASTGSLGKNMAVRVFGKGIWSFFGFSPTSKLMRLIRGQQVEMGKWVNYRSKETKNYVPRFFYTRRDIVMKEGRKESKDAKKREGESKRYL